MPVTAVVTSKSNASPGKGKLRWTSGMSSALLLLNDELNDLHLTHEELAALFNNIFKREIVRDGVQNGMTYGALARQYNDRDSTEPGVRGRWAQVLKPGRTDLARQRRFIQGVRAFVSRHAIDGRLDISKLQRSLPIVTIGSTAAETETAVVTPSSERKTLDSGKDSSALSTRARNFRIGQGSVIMRFQPILRPASPGLKRHTTSARQQYRRQNGTVINASAKQIEKAQLPLVPVPDYVARPPVTLLFRFWDHLSAGVNSDEGFIAGRFVRSEIVPTYPPTEIDHLLSDIEIHIDRDSSHHSRGRKIASPFISASNFLAISLRLALSSREDGARQFRVTVIDAERLDPRKILYVKPSHSILNSKLSLNFGAWKYPGNHEFLVWDRIPSEAVVHTFGLHDLVEHCDTDASLGQALRLGQLSQPGDYREKVVPQFKAANIKLSHEIICNIAKICQCLGLTVASPMKQIEQIVGDMRKGWEFAVEYQTPSVWAQDAAIFCDALGDGMRPTIDQQQEVKLGFLYGVRASLGGYNTLHDQTRVKTMARHADDVGLGDPAQILTDELRRVCARVESRAEQQASRYSSVPSLRRR